MFEISSSGSSNGMEQMLKSLLKPNPFAMLERFGQMGVDALAAATPVESELTARSWSYEVLQERGSWSLIWSNSNVVDGRPIAVLLQYGHATRNGGYVEGQDYINPAMKPIFDAMAAEGWKVVTKA